MKKEVKSEITLGSSFKVIDLVLKVPLYEECVIPCNKWFANDEDDGLCIRELQVRDKTMFYKN